MREGGGGEGKARGDAVIVDTAAGRKGERKKESKSVARLLGGRRERELFIGTQFSILYTSVYPPAGDKERERGRKKRRGERPRIRVWLAFLEDGGFVQSKKR